jgi:hypothetical protein
MEQLKSNFDKADSTIEVNLFEDIKDNLEDVFNMSKFGLQKNYNSFPYYCEVIYEYIKAKQGLRNYKLAESTNFNDFLYEVNFYDRCNLYDNICVGRARDIHENLDQMGVKSSIITMESIEKTKDQHHHNNELYRHQAVVVCIEKASGDSIYILLDPIFGSVLFDLDGNILSRDEMYENQLYTMEKQLDGSYNFRVSKNGGKKIRKYNFRLENKQEEGEEIIKEYMKKSGFAAVQIYNSVLNEKENTQTDYFGNLVLDSRKRENGDRKSEVSFSLKVNGFDNSTNQKLAEISSEYKTKFDIFDLETQLQDEEFVSKLHYFCKVGGHNYDNILESLRMFRDNWQLIIDGVWSEESVYS